MKRKQKDKTLGTRTNLEENLKYLNNIYKDNKEKVYKLCIECNRKYSFEMTYCPKCNEFLFPIPNIM